MKCSTGMLRVFSLPFCHRLETLPLKVPVLLTPLIQGRFWDTENPMLIKQCTGPFS